MWSLRLNKPLLLETASNGYLRIQLSRTDGKKRERFLVHRLVAATFLGPSRGRQVNHKDGDKTNNRVENLEWCTASENARHKATVLGLGVGSKNYHSKLTEEAVVRMRALRAEGKSLNTLAKMFGVSNGAVCHVVSRRHWAHV